jgi:trimeric autotransporter adhesin
MNPLTQSKNTTILPILIALALACFALLPQASATCQQGCLTNGNTVLGEDALTNNPGFENTAIGFNALFSNNATEGNTAIGWEALASNTGGSFNTAIGWGALTANTTGGSNTAIGVTALDFNTTGFGNTATGGSALALNRTGSSNTATGFQALINNNHGNDNTATGAHALSGNRTGNSNTATGTNALFNNNTGFNNTASGDSALNRNSNGHDNTAEGFSALLNTTGSSNIALGSNAGVNLTTGSNNIYIGNAGISSGEGAKIRIGTTGTQLATFIAGISGVTVPAGVGVIVGTDGKLGTVVSSERFKTETKPMGSASEVILALKPVTFRYKHELDPEAIPQFGLVAEQVEKVNPDLVVRDEQGKPYSVRYEAVNAMLLNEFLKEHRTVEEQEATIAQLKKDFRATVTQLTARLDQQAAQIQKVSAQLEVSKSAPQIVANNQ